MRSIRTYRTVIVITFAFAFLAYANVHVSGNIAGKHGTDKIWGKDQHALFHPVLLTKHLKVTTTVFPLFKKSEPHKTSLTGGFASYNTSLPYTRSNIYRFLTGVALHKYNCVLLI